MHRLGATTLAQRQVLDEIMAIRRDFEKLFADVFRRGREDGSIRAENTSIAIKGMLGAVNWTAVWYRPRANETLADKQKIARELATLQVEGVA
jgi:hypothetical protein